jgi:hypothetical protein
MNRSEMAESIRVLKADIEKIYDDAHNIRSKYLADHADEINEKTEKMEQLRKELYTVKKVFEIPNDVAKWFRQYTSGTDWGYGGIKIIYISPKKQYVIVTKKGTTAGTGTAMGTGSYYYSSSSHWIVKVGDKARDVGADRQRVEGRLSKEQKAEWIKKILELEGAI